MKSWYKYEFKHNMRRRKESLIAWVANHLPKKLAYFCAIRVGVHATTGEYSNQVVPELYFTDTLKRWK